MRKLFLSLFLLSVLHPIGWAKPVSPQEAGRVAETFLRSSHTKQFGVKSLHAVEPRLVYTGGMQAATVGRAKGAQQSYGSYYVFAAGDDGGFVIVSGDDRARSVLGYSLTGTFSPDHMPVQLRTWLGHYEAQIRSLQDRPETAADRYGSLLSPVREATDGAAPLLGAIKWGQEKPFNDLCPYDNRYGMTAPAGCVATAAVQIMKYHAWPDRGVGSHEYTTPTLMQRLSADFGNTTYEWDKMLPEYGSLYSDEAAAAVALATFHVAVAVDMDFSMEGSGATAAATTAAFKNYFNYDQNLEYIDRTHYTEAEWLAILKTEIDNGRPVLYLGEGDGGGHAFVCDGYDAQNYVHINWGWNGLSDGFYQVSALDPTVLGTGGGSGGYNYLQSLITNIQPPTENSTHMAGLHLSRALQCRDSVMTREASTTVKVGMYNYGLRDFTGKVALLLYNESGEQVAELYSRDVTKLKELTGGSPGTDFKPVKMPADVPAGEYLMYCAHKEKGTDDWVRMKAPIHLPAYVLVTVTDSEVRFALPTHAPKLRLTQQPKLLTKLYQGAKATFELTMHNEGEEFYSYVGVRLFKLDDPGVNEFVTAKIVRVPKSATRTFSFRSDNVVSLEPGLYEAVAVYDSTNMQSTYLYSMLPEALMRDTVTIEPEQESAKLHLISMVSVTATDGTDNIYERDSVVVTGRVKNAGGYTDATITAFVLPAVGEGNSLESFSPQEVSIEGGDNVELLFSKRLALEPGDYQMAFTYLGADDMWNMLSPFNPVRFTIKERPSGLTSTALDGLVCYADAAGLHLRGDVELQAVRLYDLSGFVRGTWSVSGQSADLPLDTQAAGLYIIYVQTAEGSKTFKAVISD